MDYNRDYNCPEYDARRYLSDYYSTLAGNDNDAQFYLKQLHQFFVKFGCKWDKTSATFLDFGAGPVISNGIIAAPFASEIILASYAESERKELRLWKNETQDAHDWSPFFNYVVGNLEGSRGEEAWKERAALLRRRLTITGCDIYKEHPVEITPGNLFTVVFTNLCLEAACETYDYYKKAVKKLTNLLHRGGYLVMFVVERETFYKVGEKNLLVFN